MNAVMDTPDELPTVVRIANALGEVGFLSTVAVATDVGLLVIVAHFSVPAVREFCAFAAIALVMDFILHLTYFLAVLSVDVRRLELQDFLERTDLSKTDGKWENRAPSPKKPTQNINAAFLTQAWPVSTRLAGSAIVSTSELHPMVAQVPNWVEK